MHEILNEAQREAVNSLNGPVLIIAGAGAGKTKVLVHRILNLIRNGEDPRSILAITFTNKAAKEMKDRVYDLISKDKSINSPISVEYRPFVSTFHSLGVKIIRDNAHLFDLNKHFVIHDRSDSKRVLKEAMERLSIDPKENDLGKILSKISRSKGEGLTHSDFVSNKMNFWEENVSNIWREYENIMKKEKALDFDDLLLKTMNLLEKNLDIREKYSKLWKYIHIDEYQDTNKVQYKISKLLAERNRNICVVGDADQNIYSWRGANIENILNFEKDYKEAKVILLEKNYRSTKVILQAANSVIIKNSMRKDKKLFTDNDKGEKITLIASYSETDEARSVAQIIDKMIKNGQKPSDIAILFRTNFQSRAIEDSLIKMNIPYQMIGTKFFERKEIKDVMSYLRVSLNRDSWGDMARIINVPTRGIGKATLAKISSGFFDDLSSSMKDKINSFYGLLDKIEKKAKTDKPSEIIRFIIKESGLEMSLKTKDIEDEERLRNIYELVSVAQIYDDLETEDSLSQFMENASLSSDQDEIKDEKDAVRVMTVHASKGLEFDTVFITGLEQDLFPLKHMSEKEIGLAEEEEERRLFYVALTRAKKKVYLSYAITRKVFGSEKINNSSEFIDDIELELIEEHKAERLTGVKAIFSDF